MKVIIVYGTECNEKTAWIPWLKNKLLSQNMECIIPPFPTPINQNYKSWSNILRNIEINPDDVIVAWSTGAIFSVRYLYENNLQVQKLILISGFNNYIGNVPFVDNINKDFFIKNESLAQNIARQIVCIKSDNDPFISQNALKSFAKKLNALTLNIAGGGHFNLNAGYDKFEILYDEIMRDKK